MTVEDAFEKAQRIFGDEASVKHHIFVRKDGTVGSQCDVGIWSEKETRFWGGFTFEEAFEEYGKFARFGS
jgi:hypothetical protein